MTTKDEKIIEMLKAGKNYTEIQMSLEVSPSKISQIKKEYFTTESDDERTTDTTTYTTDSSSGSIDSSAKNQQISNIKKHTNMENNDKSYEPALSNAEKFALERLKLELAQEVEMKRLENESAEQELRWRELNLRERNASASDNQSLQEKINRAADLLLKERNSITEEQPIKEKRGNEEKSKTEKQGRLIIFNFRKLVSKLVDGEWAKGEIFDFFDEKEKLEEEIERYCFANSINMEGLQMICISKKIDEMFEIPDDQVDEFEKLDDDYVFNITFDEIRDALEEAKTVDFDTYE